MACDVLHNLLFHSPQPANFLYYTLTNERSYQIICFLTADTSQGERERDVPSSQIVSLCTENNLQSFLIHDNTVRMLRFTKALKEISTFAREVGWRTFPPICGFIECIILELWKRDPDGRLFYQTCICHAQRAKLSFHSLDGSREVDTR